MRCSLDDHDAKPRAITQSVSRGIAVAGMPAGSPGIDVMSFDAGGGKTDIYEKH